ncbi:hypothetical protein BGZ60DRAFT_237327 [Tricladium varicosporioides]|nr:hypothetical protein BGZ60DRAFT_237327 [Hymenoscyphus varicosporioides]
MSGTVSIIVHHHELLSLNHPSIHHFLNSPSLHIPNTPCNLIHKRVCVSIPHFFL